MQKVAVQGQSVCRTFFGMKLCRKNVVSGYCTGENLTVFRLRRKIERDARCPSPFRTVHGIGYQLSEEIEGGNAGSAAG